MKNRNVCLNDGCMWLTDGVLCCRSCEHARTYAMHARLSSIPAMPETNADFVRWFRTCWKALQKFYLRKEGADD